CHALRSRHRHTSCFFLRCSADHLALHSFPTRRSSDLVMRRGDFQGAAQLFLASIEIPESSKSNRQLVVVVGPDVWQLVWNVLEGDRKSTRLNSSHLGISYAVFCLKKKTQ